MRTSADEFEIDQVGCRPDSWQPARQFV